MKAYVDEAICIGCGLCAGMEPDVFRMNEEGKAQAYKEPSEEEIDNVISAIESCPVAAISDED